MVGKRYAGMERCNVLSGAIDKPAVKPWYGHTQYATLIGLISFKKRDLTDEFAH